MAGKKDLISELERTAEEIITVSELKALEKTPKKLKHYIGFEISGMVHIGHASTLSVIKILHEHNIPTTIFLADWHSFINNKLGGRFENIRRASKYFEHAMRAAALCWGIDHTKIKFVLANDIYNMNYWEIVMEVAKQTTLSRTQRSLDIAGRTSGGAIPTAVLFYPSMQAADIFFLNVTIAHAGMDQRKAHIVARGAKLKNHTKPVAVHTHILQGLQKPSQWPVPKKDALATALSLKMSKSKPNSAIFIHDEEHIIRKKIRKAFCPPKETEFNPIIDWTVHLILKQQPEFIINRKKEHGGKIVIKNTQQLISAYSKGELFPLDLKNAVADWLVDFLKPARLYFSIPSHKKLLEDMEKMIITR